MSFATLLSLFVVPVLYALLAPYTRPSGTIARRLSALGSRAPRIHRARRVAFRTSASIDRPVGRSAPNFKRAKKV